MRLWAARLLAGLAILLAGAFGSRAAWADPPLLQRLATVDPWPWAAHLIEYRDRLWFAASVRFVNHNSADLYSYDPASGEARYEHHLFSQDAGAPTIHRELLYWPSEDARFSLGWGDLSATNGRHWWWAPIPGVRAFHVHALASTGDGLFASTSAWEAAIRVSRDGGLTWRTVLARAGPEGTVRRFPELTAVGSRLFAVAQDGLRQARYALLMIDGERGEEVPDWPTGARTLALTPWRGQLYGLVQEEAGWALWASDGTASRRLGTLPGGERFVAMTVDDRGLWALGRRGEGGTVWHSPDGVTWQAEARVEDGAPAALAVLGGQPFVAGRGGDNRASLWGPPPIGPRRSDAGPRPALPARGPAADMDWADLGTQLDAALRDPASYAPGSTALRDQIFRAAAAGAPAGFFTSRLAVTAPDVTLSLIGGAVEASATQRARWLLLWGATVGGRGAIETHWLSASWTEPENPSGKYFGSVPAALWATAAGTQNDRATIDALVERLRDRADPLWLSGDVIGALSAITGQRFAYDVDAWSRWWTRARGAWK